MIQMSEAKKTPATGKNQMKKIKIEKVTLNVGAGKDQKLLEKSVKLLKNITGIEPVTTKTNKRIAAWGLRPGLPIGCKITLRGKESEKLLARMLEAKENILDERNFDESGNVSFGIAEYIDIPGVEYDPNIGVTGLQICVTLERNGFRVKKRRLLKAKIGKTHKITRDDAINFMKDQFKVAIGEQDEL
jgi:large subunit ribosomal protein L5